MTTKPQTIVFLSKPRFMRLGLTQAKLVYGSLTSEQWEEAYRFLEALWDNIDWHRETIKRFKDESRTNNRGAAQILCSEPQQPRYEIYS